MVNEAEVEKVIAFMRRHGATRLKVDGLEVELGPAPLGLPAETSSSTGWAAEEPTRCPCGCPLEEHSEAGCLRGCSGEACDPPGDVEKA